MGNLEPAARFNILDSRKKSGYREKTKAQENTKNKLVQDNNRELLFHDL